MEASLASSRASKADAGVAATAAPSLLRRAVYGFYMISVALVPMTHVGAIRRFGPVIQLSDLVFAAAAGLWLIALATRRIRLTWHRSYWGVLVYLAASLISVAATPSLRTSAVKLVGFGFLITLMVMTASL